MLAFCAAVLAPSWPTAVAQESVTADGLARSGDHAGAAALYERQARRLFRAWDTRLTLLAAREYLAAGESADAARVLKKIDGPVTGDVMRGEFYAVQLGVYASRQAL